MVTQVLLWLKQTIMHLRSKTLIFHLNSVEIECFLGVLIWMGLVRLPRISDYWLTHLTQ